MFQVTLLLVKFVGLIFPSSASDPPSECRFLNAVRSSVAETALLDYFNRSEPFVFSETNFFQPQCLLCEKLDGELCFGYRGGMSHGASKALRLVANLPYLYALADKVGTNYTTVTAIAALREDLIIPYRTLTRFKVGTLSNRSDFL